MPRLDALSDKRYRFANHLRGFAEFDDDGEVAALRRAGQRTTRPLERCPMAWELVDRRPSRCPERRGEPVVGPGWVRFEQTWGGRTVAHPDEGDPAAAVRAVHARPSPGRRSSSRCTPTGR